MLLVSDSCGMRPELAPRCSQRAETITSPNQTTTPGTKGVILPLAVAGDVAELLRQAVALEARPPSLADRLRDTPTGE